MNPTHIPTEHRDLIMKLLKPGDVAISQMTPDDFDFLHAAVGISTEAGELLEAVLPMRLSRDYAMRFTQAEWGEPDANGARRCRRYPSFNAHFWKGETGHGVDLDNIFEELGDHLFYEGALRITVGMENLGHLTPSVGLWPLPFGPVAQAREEEGTGRKRVLCDLLDIHSVIAAKILDQAKRRVMYRKEIDRGVLEQLLADDCWVLENVVMLLGTSEENLRARNIEKLFTGEKARYKDGYSDAAAVARADKTEEVAQ